MTPNSDFQFMYKESGNSMTTAKLQSARLLPHWRPSRTLAYNSFRWGAIRLFNSLPKTICDIKNCSVCSFKQRLDHYLSSIPDLPCSPGYNNSLDGGDYLDWRQCGNSLALCYFAVVMELPVSLWMNCKSEIGVIFLRCSPR